MPQEQSKRGRLLAGWEMRMPGYATHRGQTKAERKRDHVVRWCDARGDKVRVHADDGQGVPSEVVLACIEAASEFPAEFKL